MTCAIFDPGCTNSFSGSGLTIYNDILFVYITSAIAETSYCYMCTFTRAPGQADIVRTFDNQQYEVVDTSCASPLSDVTGSAITLDYTTDPSNN